MTTPITHDLAAGNRIVVVRQEVGWQVREEQGDVLLRSATVTDWHRVERTMQTFQHQPFRRIDPHD